MAADVKPALEQLSRCTTLAPDVQQQFRHVAAIAKRNGLALGRRLASIWDTITRRGSRLARRCRATFHPMIA